MNHAQLIKLEATLNQVEGKFNQDLQQLETVWECSIVSLVESAFKEIRVLLQQASIQTTQLPDNSTTDATIIREYSEVFNRILQICSSLRRHFTGLQDDTNFLQTLEQQIYVCQAHTRFYASVALINKAQFHDYDADLMQQKASGFLALAETIDFFKDYLDPRNLERVNRIAQQAIKVSSRTVHAYAEIEPERSRLETQIRAASYLILAATQKLTDKESETYTAYSPIPDTQAASSESPIVAFANISDPIESDRLRNEAERDALPMSHSSQSRQPSEQDWDTLMAFLEDSQDDMGVTDLAHQHDYYLHGAPKRLES